MSHAGGNYQARVVRPALVVALDDDAHHLPRHPRALIHEQHLHIALNEEHRIPLLAIIRAQCEIFNILHEEPPEPRLGRRALGDVRRMNVKALRSPREHARRRPLPRPHADRVQRPLALPREFAEKTAVPLRKNTPRKNLHAWNPRSVEFRALRDRLTSLDARRGETPGWRFLRIVALPETLSRGGVKAFPKWIHARGSYAATRRESSARHPHSCAVAPNSGSCSERGIHFGSNAGSRAKGPAQASPASECAA